MREIHGPENGLYSRLLALSANFQEPSGLCAIVPLIEQEGICWSNITTFFLAQGTVQSGLIPLAPAQAFLARRFAAPEENKNDQIGKD